MKAHRIATIAAFSLLAACAAQVPPARKPVAQVPPLDPKVSRVMIAAGMMDRGSPQGITLADTRHVGPVYVDGKYVGDIAESEYLVVDVKPGMHDVSCSPLEPVKNYPEQRHVSFEPGQTKSLVCDMASARGDLADKFVSKSYLEPLPIDPQQGRVVDYKKLP
jgi:hypothetical protein